MTYGLESKQSGLILKKKDKEKVNKKGQCKQENMEASYEKQKDACDKVNKCTNNLYSTKIYNISRVH